jgi:hypothetical protein
MFLFISKYELRMITIKEYHFQDRDDYYTAEIKLCDITKMYGMKLKYMPYNNKYYISFEFTCFGADN